MGSSGVSVDNGTTGDVGVSLFTGTAIDIGVSIGFGGSVISWPTGDDGALLINGTTVNLPAGSIKNYSSITIINSGVLNIINSLPSNVGCIPTIIGCSGNLIINTGGRIIGRCAAGSAQMSSPNVAQTFANTVPAGGAVSSVSFDYSFVPGGHGGDAVNGGSSLYGHGGGGLGFGNGGNATADIPPSHDWGVSGPGAPDRQFGNVASGIPAYPSSFGASGSDGEGVESSGGNTVAGGGAGGVRGLGGTCLYLQVAGSITFPPDDEVIVLSGGDGGNGGNGGMALDTSGSPGAGGGGGGGAGGNGGKFICRYKSGSITEVNVNVGNGFFGSGGFGGFGEGSDGPFFGPDGDSGSDGNNGIKDIATY